MMEKISKYDAGKRFEAFLDECWEDIMVCGLPYLPSRVLPLVDGDYYNELFNNWLDSEGLELED